MSICQGRRNLLYKKQVQGQVSKSKKHSISWGKCSLKGRRLKKKKTQREYMDLKMYHILEFTRNHLCQIIEIQQNNLIHAAQYYLVVKHEHNNQNRVIFIK